MEKWSADFVNNHYDDYNLIVEILYNNEEIAVVKQGKHGMEMKWYPNVKELTIPMDWFLELIKEFEIRTNY